MSKTETFYEKHVVEKNLKHNNYYVCMTCMKVKQLELDLELSLHTTFAKLWNLIEDPLENLYE